MGRMLVRGEGRYLYNKAHFREAIGEAYQADDAATIDGWLIESEERPGVGGPLYPPIHALLFYPLGLLPPQRAYRIDQLLNFSLTFAIGFLAWQLTRGRLWASVAVGILLAFPGYIGAIMLGRNSLVSLVLLLLGWLLMDRGRPWWGGAVWGLLAFKPVWAVSFFVVPLLNAPLARLRGHGAHGNRFGAINAPVCRLADLARLADGGTARPPLITQLMKRGFSSAATCKASHAVIFFISAAAWRRTSIRF